MKVALAAWLAVITWASAPPSARAAEPQPQPLAPAMAEAVTRAESAFRIQNYPRVIEILVPVIDNPALQAHPDYKKALEWLGAAQWYTGKRSSALQKPFTELMKRWPKFRLSDLVHPAALIKDFDDHRQFLIENGIIDPFGDPSATSMRVLVRDVVANDTPTIAYLAPFGVGQFVNDEVGKGTAVAVLQGVGLATAAGTWIGVEQLKNSRGVVAAEDEDTATVLRALWVAGAALFVATYVYGIVDGLANRSTEPEVHYYYRVYDKGDLPDDIPDDSVQLDFGPAPAGLGLGAYLSF